MTVTYNFEFEDPIEQACGCCGSPIISLTRFVYRNGDAFAVYKAALSFGSHERVADIVFNVGEGWGDNVSSHEHPEFALKAWCDDETFKFSVVEPHDSGWKPGLLSSILSRKNQMDSPYIGEVFAMCDQIVVGDEVIIRYLSERPSLN